MTTKDITAAFTSVYNKKFELELLGSLDDYKAKWESAKAKEPENVWAWLVEYVILFLSHFAAPAFLLFFAFIKEHRAIFNTSTSFHRLV
jgi:hypothetical protein